MKYKIICLILLITLLSGVIIAQGDTETVEPVTANDDWTPVIQEFDGVEMVLVPPGCFMMGSSEKMVDLALAMCIAIRDEDRCSRERFENEIPEHKICFGEPFWIDRYEVSNGQFDSFEGVTLGGHGGDPNLPRGGITWFEARDFCELRGGRLPTEAEWEYAARGPDGLIFPWSNAFDDVSANFCDANCQLDWADETVDDGYDVESPVGNYEGGVSWVGVYDLSGNVIEWTNTIRAIDLDMDGNWREDNELFDYPYDPTDGREADSNDDRYSRVVRGGSWLSHDLRAMVRSAPYADNGVGNIGFRCARDYEPSNE
jgi:formylglycine-generating enzyme required for sulfatase activity